MHLRRRRRALCRSLYNRQGQQILYVCARDVAQVSACLGCAGTSVDAEARRESQALGPGGMDSTFELFRQPDVVELGAALRRSDGAK